MSFKFTDNSASIFEPCISLFSSKFTLAVKIGLLIIGTIVSFFISAIFIFKFSPIGAFSGTITENLTLPFSSVLKFLAWLFVPRSRN